MTAEHATRPTIAPTAEDGAVTLLSWLREMRDSQPVWRDAYGVWHVFRYADVQRAISDSEVLEADGERLTDEEVVNFSLVLLLAGHITTTALIDNTVLCLDERPDMLAELHTDSSLIPAAIEEVLRYRCPFTYLGRVTMVETELAGQIIPADALVTPWLLAANRDEREFTDPDQFDIHRAANHHVTFGHGIHFCIGQLLARVEARVAVGVLLDRYADIRLNPAVPPTFYGRGIFAARTLPVSVRPPT